AGQTRYPTSSNSKSANRASNGSPPLRWKSPPPAVRRPGLANDAQVPANASAVDYEISGETYQDDSEAAAAPPRSAMRRRVANPRPVPQRVYRDRDDEPELSPEYYEEQAQYEDVAEEFAETDAMASGDPESEYEEYNDALQEGEYWGGEAGF